MMRDLRFEAEQNRSLRQPSIHGFPARGKVPQIQASALRGSSGSLSNPEILRMTQQDQDVSTQNFREI
ncbi:MAG TPA: hypothetical protein VGG20_16365 [Thermoanaerobaculia bacterium]